MSTKDSKLWEKEDFATKENVFKFFEDRGYTIGDTEPIDPELVFQRSSVQILENVKELYQVVREHEFQVWLIVVSDEGRKKTFRQFIEKKVAEGLGEYALFFTEDFTQFWIGIIVGEDNQQIVPAEIQYDTSNPSPLAERFLENLSNKKLENLLTASAAHAKHLLRGSKLIETLKQGDEKKLALLFKRGLALEPSAKIIKPRDDAPLKNSCLEIALNIGEQDLQNWIDSQLASTVGVFYETEKKSLELIVLVTADSIAYISGRGEIYGCVRYPDEETTLKSIFATIIACFDIRGAFNSQSFEQQFGIFSPFFIKGKYLMEKYLKENNEKMKVIWEEWERHFSKVYRLGDLDNELFIKHAYLSLLIKNALFCKYLPAKVVMNARSFIELSEYFDERGVEMFFYDFYAWANEITEIRDDIFHSLHGAIYETDDIFRVIYQDMVSPSTRHALGEFYTPPELARLMVDDIYEIGKVILDPACGSGTFLVEIISKIKQAPLSFEEKVEAISNIFGFDVNPIAVLVSKANILLHLEDMNLKQLPVNIFLTDSLFPVKKKAYQDYKWGNSELFIMGDEIVEEKGHGELIHGTIGELVINEKFFDPDKMGDLSKFLRFIDELMVRKASVNEIIHDFDNQFLQEWLDEKISSSSISSNTCRLNMHHIIKKLANLHQNKQNHIWLYLLYNSLGARILRKKVDLIIGNPPWLNLNGINSMEYKERVKKESERFDILMGGRNAANTEITSLFFYCCKDLYLKSGGKIFFVVTAGMMAGEQHSKFRRFKDFGNVKIWNFDSDVFRIHNICLKVDYMNQNLQKRIRVQVIPIKSEEKDQILVFEKMKPEIYIPNNIVSIENEDDLVGRLIPENQLKNLLPRGESHYLKLFYNGGRLMPRILVFINILSVENDSIVKFEPNMNLQKKPPWDFKPYDYALVEKDYIYKTAKSTELIPFKQLDFYEIFLPLERDDLNLHSDRIKPLAKQHLALLDTIYKTHQKKGASITDFWKNINHLNKLTNERQKGELKIAFPGIGGMICAAIIRGNVIIDDSLYYYSTNDENEAYFLMGILNSRSITTDIKLRGSTGAGGGLRNIHKRPLEYNIPKYDNSNELHESIVQKSKELELKVAEIVEKWIIDEMKKVQAKENRNAVKEGRLAKQIDPNDFEWKSLSIQNLISKNLNLDFEELDALIMELLNKSSNKKGESNAENNR